MTVKEFYDVFDKGTPFFFIVMDSAKKWTTDAYIFEELNTKRVSAMIVDRIAFFPEPEFVIQWTDCKEDYRCQKECANVMVIFAHDEGEEVVCTKLKMETIDDLQSYVEELNAAHGSY